ncbi:MAG TPA: hypothetical protein VI479_16110 [Blastocatellia bacterium]
MSEFEVIGAAEAAVTNGCERDGKNHYQYKSGDLAVALTSRPPPPEMSSGCEYRGVNVVSK